MDERKTKAKYIVQFFSTFGIIVTLFILLALITGNESKNISSLYAFGNEAIGIKTLSQLFLFTIIITLTRILFLTDILIKNLKLYLRICLFVGVIFIFAVLFIFLFYWFDYNNFSCWIVFVICFGVCTSVSMVITYLKEKNENEKMEEALKKFNKE